MAYHPSYFPRPSYGWNRPPHNNAMAGYKRGPQRSTFDRLSMGFIKRADEIPTDPYVEDDENDGYYDTHDLVEELSSGLKKLHENDVGYMQKRYMDRLMSGFVRKKRSTDTEGKDEELQHDTNSKENQQSELSHQKGPNIDEKRSYLDRLHSGFVKRPFDRLQMGFVKKSDGEGEFVEKKFDRLMSGFVKKDANEQKRRFDRLSMGFVKRPSETENFDEEKRRFDRLQSGFVKRRLDRLYSGFVKRPFDRLYSGFVKKDENMDDYYGTVPADKRRLDRLYSGFVRRDGQEEDGDFYGDTLEPELEKRRFDRLSMGFVKKSTDGVDTNDMIENDKRRLDRLYSGFVKKDDDSFEPEEKRRFDRLSSGFVKRPFDRLNMGFVKREEDSDDADMQKRRFDRLTSGFVKRSEDLETERMKEENMA